MRSLLALLTGASLLVLASGASAVTVFTAVLEGSQEVPPVATDASGSAELTLNDEQDRLEIVIQLSGLDLIGSLTPGDPSDDVTGAHIHQGPAGTNGPIVFGFIGPNDDTTGDLVVNGAAGTIESAWDASEGLGAEEIAALFEEGLYLNVHTVENTAGEIRGQIVPEPAGASLLAGGLLALALRPRSR